jgi:hypothetical protein
VPGYPCINGPVASWNDAHVCVVNDDGTTSPMPLVRGVRFEGREGSDPVVMILEVYNPEIDIELDECQVKTVPQEERLYDEKDVVPIRWDDKAGGFVTR